MKSPTRKNFERIFTEMLAPFGFILYNKCICKVDDENGIVWVVTLYIKGGTSFGSIRYSVAPYCHSITPLFFIEGMEQVDRRYGAWRERIEIPKFNNDPEYALNLGAMIFREDLLDRFVSIHNIREYQDFRNWHEYTLFKTPPEIDFGLYGSIWENIQLGEFEVAYQKAQAATRKSKEYYEASPHLLEYPGRREGLEREIALESLLARKDYDTLESMLQERIRNSRNACREFFAGKG